MSAFLSAFVSRAWGKKNGEMPRKATGSISPFRAARLAEGRGWSLRYVAHKIHSNLTSLSEWERHISEPPLEVQQALCKLYKALPADLGFADVIPRSGDESLSRRPFLTTALVIPIAAGVLGTREHARVSGETLATLAQVNERYRSLQLEGVVYSREQLQGHVATIEHLLATTIHSQSRRELYRLLSQAQLLSCSGRTNPERLTLTEKAVASAQQSGDTLLLAAALSFLGQVYNYRLHQPEFAENYLQYGGAACQS